MGNSRDNPALSVVVVTYNSAEVLPGFLDSLPGGLEGIARYEVFVVDNASKDDSIAIALSHPIAPTVISMGRNAGYAAGINAASSRFRLDSDILILNPDVRMLRGAALPLVETLADPAIGAAVPSMLNDDNSLAMSLRREPSVLTAWSDAFLGSKLAARFGIGEILLDQELYDQGGPVDWATGAALAVSAQARRDIGVWDESFFLYSEEVDYLRRIRASGRKVVFVPQSRVTHIGGEYHANPRLSALMTANRIRYFRRYHGAAAAFLFRLAIIVASGLRFALGPGHRAALGAALSRWRPPPETSVLASVQPKIVRRSA
jgi:N-acetylglucosaminyl-diphospho-decaprenol L-rhamnosyltransferase